ncbi:glycoside hydrolase family 2 TIM barrel-domain containing protein [Paenibacillus sp. UMB4589-SE434]|uniref:glycoside hydrolase family 2 protein n=1 Tax=Paenibacillus sp. UMB4589-SE434 TaxID=3046314 RepID=UPI00254F818D|nr:glycoside hydrolase family 2 TIM barrel-domain containing protein [Paenibacillus sp. UMB4589-SE434]MDK8182181.1 glycoside hydrolase family 2 TIM barrel-domain containing protein [Paenibacillus sp. UMB4589-SE434]
MCNRLPQQMTDGFLLPTFQIEQVKEHAIAFQSGIPVPTFEPQKRQTLSLHGVWRKQRFAADHDQSLTPRSMKWISEVEADAKGRTELQYDDSEWTAIELPGPENRMSGEESSAGAERYEDGVWYRRTFHVPIHWLEMAVTLKSLGISYVCDIWINGQWAGYHEGGFTPFALDVTSMLREGTNMITIRIDNPPWGSRIDMIPARADTDFFNYTGVIQDLYLEAAPTIHIARLDVVPQNEQGRLFVKAVIENRSAVGAQATLEGKLYEATTETDKLLASPYADDIRASVVAVDDWEPRSVKLEPWQSIVVTWHLHVHEPKLWDMEHPHLYVAELSLCREQLEQRDQLATQFGIRTIRTSGTQIQLNGHAVFLRGIARHEEWPRYGRTAAWERIKTDLQQIQQLHANMVRTAHYPNHIYTYLLTDRLGLAAMSEIPLWQFETIHYEAQEQKRLADQMWREMIYSQFNRPSVLLWSTQNESKEVKLRKIYNERLVHDVRSNYADDRLITQSAAADQPGAHDESMEPLDVAAWTMYFGIFHGGTAYEGTQQFLEEAHKLWPDKPILNTEYGYWSQEDNSDAHKQVQMYHETLRALLERATVTAAGLPRPEGFVAGIDYWSIYNWYVNHSQWVQTMGLYQMDRLREKPVKQLLQQDYGRLAGR